MLKVSVAMFLGGGGSGSRPSSLITLVTSYSAQGEHYRDTGQRGQPAPGGTGQRVSGFAWYGKED